MLSLKEIMNIIANNPVDFLEDANLAYRRLNEMKDTGEKLVRKYGKCQAEGIDDYYHSLLHCELGQEGHKETSQALGELKEFSDYLVKVFHDGKKEEDVINDMRKDLTNNSRGYKIGENNKGKDCRILLKEKRTRNMKDANIW